MGIKSFVQDHSSGVAEAVKLSPPVAVTATGAAGMDWQTWILVGTFIYTVLLIVHKLVQLAREVRKYRKQQDDSTTLGDL